MVAPPALDVAERGGGAVGGAGGHALAVVIDGIATISETEKPAGSPLAALSSVVAACGSLSFAAIVD